jgi:hypothetical protein
LAPPNSSASYQSRSIWISSSSASRLHFNMLNDK